MRLTIIVTTDLFLVLGLRMNDDLRNQNSEHIFEQLNGEVHFCPVVTLFHDFEHIT